MKGAGGLRLLVPAEEGVGRGGLLDLSMEMCGSSAPWALGEEVTGVPGFSV